MDCKIKNVTDNTFQAKDLLYIHPRIFETAIKAGINALNRTTSYHPITSSGSLIWSEIVGVFRRTVIKTNATWRTEFKNGLSLLVNSDINSTIVISSGNSDTGLLENAPCTRNGKGTATFDFVGHNYELWNITDEACADTHRTYVLLYHIDKIKDQIRYELSLPMQTKLTGKRGKIQIYKWEKRVIFEPIATHKREIDDNYQRRVLVPKLNAGVRYRGALRDLNP